MTESIDYSHLPYRPCVGIMLVNQFGKVFVAKRIDTKAEAWQMPQGGIDEGESPEVAAFRELLEETGVKKATIMAQSADWKPYNLPEHLVPVLWGGKFRGQEQKWFVMRLDGPESDINIVTEIPEFSEWKWVEVSELPDLIVPFKRELYAELVEEFSPAVAAIGANKS